jgi:signal transduction histidine kinase
MAHELRNPLMAMKILVQSARERGGGTHLSDQGLEVLEVEIGRLERLIQSFLDFARPPQPERREFELINVIEQTLRLISSRARQQRVEIIPHWPAPPLWLTADMGQFRQVLLNLLLNALDAVPCGGSVWLDVESSSGSLTIRVADSGPGLPADVGAHIFEPFVTTKESSTGLGLAIGKRIVEAHGGIITASNRPEGGAVFRMDLPLTSRAPVPAAASETVS